MPQTLRPRPQPLPFLTNAISLSFRLPAFMAATVVCGSLSLLASLTESNGRKQHRIAQAWAKLSMGLAGSTMRIVGAEHLQSQSVAVYACNHLSYMDTPAIFSSLPFQFRIVARHNLWSVPFIGWHLNRSGQIPVNVENPRASVASLSNGVKTLKAGMPIFIFPEGGRTRTGDPGPFLNGPVFMAVRAQVSVVPMALVGTHELLPIHTKAFFPTPVTLVVGEPISTKGLTPRDIEPLTEELRKRISSMYYEHSWRTAPDNAPETQEAEAEAGV